MTRDEGAQVNDLDYIARNQAEWKTWAEEYVGPGRSNWAGEPTWGIWGIPESDVGVLPDVAGKDTLELGCGTAYVSAWLARRGGRPVGLDPTPEQLATAASFQQEFDLSFPLIRGVAEAVPLPDASFDVVISEYGACLWSDPYRWIPEAARLLRAGGELVFLTNGAILMLCVPGLETEGAADSELRRDYFGMHRFDFDDTDATEFHLNHGDWIRLLRANGFEVEDLLELRPGSDATTRYPFVTLEWARRWPSEEVWKARKVR